MDFFTFYLPGRSSLIPLLLLHLQEEGISHMLLPVSHSVFVAPLSYAMSSSLSPIRIIPSVGVIFCAFKVSTFALISSLIEAFTSFS